MNLDLVFIASMIGLGFGITVMSLVKNVIIRFLMTTVIIFSVIGITYTSIWYAILQILKLFCRVLGA